MKLSLRLVSAVLLVFMLLVATEMGPVAVEGRTCESPSHRFKGACLSETNCANVCHNEGFIGGNCRGLRRRCFCTKHC
ncbi:PREDICTED: defensin-like protein 2 [Tarenaya hassleriana]|uniref:defensin-like protein 2 n=1 Tax=Tarenaya hassleriana TaxID=28532 RepID=UPI0008FCF94C|nr:PREDICTED: defensin-like protein 2 [Tarenaya hassleriana]